MEKVECQHQRCHELYVKVGRNQRFCSRSCRKAAYWEEHPDYRIRHAENNRRWRKRRSEAERLEDNETHRLRPYDLTKEGLLEIWEKQKHKCAICGKSISAAAPIDHDHKTNRVRG